MPAVKNLFKITEIVGAGAVPKPVDLFVYLTGRHAYITASGCPSYSSDTYYTLAKNEIFKVFSALPTGSRVGVSITQTGTEYFHEGTTATATAFINAYPPSAAPGGSENWVLPAKSLLTFFENCDPDQTERITLWVSGKESADYVNAATWLSPVTSRTGDFQQDLGKDVRIFPVAFEESVSTTNYSLFNSDVILGTEFAQEVIARDKATATEYRFCTGLTEVNYQGFTFSPVTLERGEISVTQDPSRSDLTLRLPRTEASSLRWMKNSFEIPLKIVVYEVAEDSSVTVSFRGISDEIVPEGDLVSVRFNSSLSKTARQGLSGRASPTCRHALYDSGCKVDMNLFKTTSAATVSGETLTMTLAQPDGYYNGGFVELSSGERRYVVSHSGNNLMLIRGFSEGVVGFGYGENYGNNYAGLLSSAFPGCDKRSGTCLTRFANLLNFGGFESMPLDQQLFTGVNITL